MTFTYREAEEIIRIARRVWNEIANDCGAPDDPEVIAECVMDADRLTTAVRRKNATLGAKVEDNILAKELEDIVKRAFM
jgi:hypothetical protein